MAYQQKDNTGALWKNEKENDRQPDYSGNAVIAGVPHFIDAWIKNNPRSEDYDPAKKTFLSVTFKPKKQQREEQRGAGSDKRQHDLSKPRHMPPPPLNSREPEKYQPAKPTDPEIPFEP